MAENKKKPIVSVIVTTYNRKEFLKQTINSILNQTLGSLELIVVDNFSNYDFFDFIKSFHDERLHPYQNANYDIIAVNKNFGIKKAVGDYIAFCDDDDFWDKSKLELQIKEFNNTDIVGAGTSVKIIGESRPYRNKFTSENLLLDFNSILRNCSVPISSLVVRNYGFLFDESEKIKCVDDFEFQLRLTLITEKKLILLSAPLTFYRIHPENLSSISPVMSNAFNVYKKFKKNISNELYNQLIAKQNINLGIQALGCGNKDAKKFFKKATNNSNGKLKYTSMIFIIISVLPDLIIKKMIIVYCRFHNIVNKENSKFFGCQLKRINVFLHSFFSSSLKWR